MTAEGAHRSSSPIVQRVHKSARQLLKGGKKHSDRLKTLFSRLKESEGARVSARKSRRHRRPSTKHSKALVKRIKERMGTSISNRRRKRRA